MRLESSRQVARSISGDVKSGLALLYQVWRWYIKNDIEVQCN